MSIIRDGNKPVIIDGPPPFSLMGIAVRFIVTLIYLFSRFPSVFHGITIVVGAVFGALLAILSSLAFAYVFYFMAHIGFVDWFFYVIAYFSDWETVEQCGWSFGFCTGIITGSLLLAIIVRLTNADSAVSRTISVLLGLGILWWWIVRNEIAMESTAVGLVFKSAVYVACTLFVIYIACVDDEEESQES